MKKGLLIGGIVLVALSGSAMAADLGKPAPVYKAPVYKAPPAPAWTWTGFYVGAHGGGGWSTADWTSDFNCFPGVMCDPVNTAISGWLAGGQAGYRWQTGAFVFGVEGTGSVADIRGNQTGKLCTSSFIATGCGSLVNPSYTTRIDQVETATAQAGYAWDRALFYAKGGWAGGNIVRRLSSAPTLGGPVDTGDLNERANGWTVGAGLEYMFWNNISLGVEYDFVRLPVGSVTSTINTLAPFQTTQSSLSLGTHEVLARLNYRFSFDH